MTSWTSYFEQRLNTILQELQTYVEIESPTHNKHAVDQMGELIQARFAELGCRVDVIPQTEFGNQLRIEYGDGEEQIMVLGHFDTVKEIGTLVNEPWRVEGGKAYGPGSYDMKAGIVFSYFALQAIREHNLPLNKKLVFFWNTDEEVGSHSSAEHIRQEAAKSSCVLVVEPGFEQGELKTSRKGGGDFVVRAYGRAAHAGNDHDKGINAIEELAHQIIQIQSWTDYAAGTTLSVGKIKGGSATNVVPEFAEMAVDVRASRAAEAERITKLMLGLSPRLTGSRLEVTGGFEKLPMERTDLTERLYLHAVEQAALEGFAVGEKAAGGMSDGNTAATSGVPVLDGLGPVGDGAHASHEHVVVGEIPHRIALLLRLFTTL